MKDYNHNGRIDSEDELLLQEMVIDRLDESIEKHFFRFQYRSIMQSASSLRWCIFVA